MAKDPIEQLRLLCWPESRDYVNGLLDDIEAQYMKLPIGADSVPIKPGDLMQIDFDEYVEVVSITGDRWFYFSLDDGYCYMSAKNSYHEMPDAINDLLEEFSHLFMTCMDHDYMGDDTPESLRNEYAKKIREVVTNG